MLCAPQTSPAETLGLQLLWETLVAAPLRSGSVSEISVFARPPITTEHTLAHVEVNGVEAEVAPLVCRGVEFLDVTEGPLTTIGHIAQLGPERAALPDLSLTAETPLWSGATSPRIRDPTVADRAVRTAPRPLSAGRLRARRS